MSNKEKFSNLLKFGINLELKSEEEHLFYAQCFTSWVMQQEHFDASMASDTDIEIYNYKLEGSKWLIDILESRWPHH